MRDSYLLHQENQLPLVNIVGLNVLQQSTTSNVFATTTENSRKPYFPSYHLSRMCSILQNVNYSTDTNVLTILFLKAHYSLIVLKVSLNLIQSINHARQMYVSHAIFYWLFSLAQTHRHLDCRLTQTSITYAVLTNLPTPDVQEVE